MDQAGLNNNRIYNLFLGKKFPYTTKSEQNFLLEKLPAYNIVCFILSDKGKHGCLQLMNSNRPAENISKSVQTYFLSTKNLMYCKAPASAAIQHGATIDYFCCCCSARRKICNFYSLATAFHNLFFFYHRNPTCSAIENSPILKSENI